MSKVTKKSQDEQAKEQLNPTQDTRVRKQFDASETKPRISKFTNRKIYANGTGFPDGFFDRIKADENGVVIIKPKEEVNEHAEEQPKEQLTPTQDTRVRKQFDASETKPRISKFTNRKTYANGTGFPDGFFDRIKADENGVVLIKPKEEVNEHAEEQPKEQLNSTQDSALKKAVDSKKTRQRVRRIMQRKTFADGTEIPESFFDNIKADENGVISIKPKEEVNEQSEEQPKEES